MDHPDIFEPFDRLITITVCGKKLEVPENNTILRCLQYVDMEAVSYGDFCWNGECLNCQVWIDNNGKEKALIACRAIATDGMNIIRLDDDISSAFGQES